MSFRDALNQYIEHPTKYDDVIFHDDNVVIIRDKFPKSIRHFLIIPKSKLITHIHPLDVFNRNYIDQKGDELYELMLEYVEKAKDLIVQDLSTTLNHLDNIKASEFKNSFIRAGIHSVPSLRNLHIHVITQDFHSDRMKNKKHYNSFTTKFFVDFEQLDPMLNEKFNKLVNRNENYDSSSAHESESDDGIEYVRHVRNGATLNEFLKSDLKCVYCGVNFEKSMVKLKEHLKIHFKEKYQALGDYQNLLPNASR
ncbi:histidine triad superfamily, third branch [Suhomyces tanzawaensis NRRL Y-17324]|uniref:Histidine triad superfamily, third branch n=1 Tax=Suhomyces tanzawaensis NRRL Y-17324 TaxID=984487 RepID=A0A1E4SK92_9ASCO|nr:histidine triad superfamily, third branch [Suhomyces tanzawaensis NRRL Y-17324]ODV79910.1 histidine triad superfamily, third branch [Suhomyces tanzawaensis NRRL Y-17324]